MRMMRYSFSIEHVPGKHLSTADTLSRAPISEPTKRDTCFNEEVNAYVQSTFSNLPATEKRLEEIRSDQDSNSVCKQITTYFLEGWMM